jgi:DNA-directed RNA polymerase II subunit RPB11
MKLAIKILKEAGNRLEVEIPNEDHTLGNLLRSTLLRDKTVKYAGYQIVHPLTGGIKLVIETDDAKPREALMRAISLIEQETQDFRGKFKKVI